MFIETNAFESKRHKLMQLSASTNNTSADSGRILNRDRNAVAAKISQMSNRTERNAKYEASIPVRGKSRRASHGKIEVREGMTVSDIATGMIKSSSALE
jgi:hypothetical protein